MNQEIQQLMNKYKSLKLNEENNKVKKFALNIFKCQMNTIIEIIKR